MVERPWAHAALLSVWRSRRGSCGCHVDAAVRSCPQKRNNHFQLACQTAFEGAHSCACDAGINHPNQYFEESCKAIDGDAPTQATPAENPRSHQAEAALSAIPAMPELAASSV